MNRLRLLTLRFLLASTFLAALPVLPGADVDPLEPLLRLRGDGAHARVRDEAKSFPTNGLSRADHRRFRWLLHDSAWRGEGDRLRSAETEAALKAMDADFPQEAPQPDRDRAWAEAQESLGDLHHRRNDPWEWRLARHGHALGWWAAQSDLETARTRYLDILWRLARPATGQNPYWRSGISLPLEWIQDAVRIARRPADVAHARLLRALAFQQFGPPDERALYQVEDDFRAAIAAGKDNDWYDDSLDAYAQWLEGSGRLVIEPTGGWRRENDAARALEFYRRIVAEFPEGGSAVRRRAEERIQDLLRPETGIGISSVFLPGHGVEFQLRWRNSRRIQWSLTPVDLTRDLRLPEEGAQTGSWLDHLTTGGRAPALTRGFDTGDDGQHNAAQTNVVLRPGPATGAYLVQAKGDASKGRELLLVSDAALTLRSRGGHVLAWFTDAITGQPIPEARVRVWQGYLDGQTWRIETHEGETDASGIATFRIRHTGGEFLATAALGARQAFCRTWAGGIPAAPEGWRFYAATDRPAYRPGDTVHWKVSARLLDGDRLRTPDGRDAFLELRDGRGQMLTNGPVRFNTFGSAWGELALPATTALGTCRVQFWNSAERTELLGEANLFRIEEYRLPEFTVSLGTPVEETTSGPRRRTFKLGETVEIDIRAELYSGGPVADAAVELLIRERPWSPWFPAPREFDWFQPAFAGQDAGRSGFRPPNGPERRESLRTDSTGRARFRLESNAAGNDTEYEIEARVTDAGQREVRASDRIRVTRQRHFASASVGRRVLRPGDPVTADVRTRDANDQPVAVPGTVRLVRQVWEEVWRDPAGKTVGGEDLERRRRSAAAWPPGPDRRGRAWSLVRRGYVREVVSTGSLDTGTNGLASMSFRPDREGYYTVEWTSPGNATAPTPPDPRPRPFEAPVTAESAFWVCQAGGAAPGYHRDGGVELVLDRDAHATGTRAPVLVATDAPGRWILLSTETGGEPTHQVLRVLGTSRLVEIDIGDRLAPNFWLTASGVWDGTLHSDTKEVVVPPVSRFLDIRVTPDASVRRPGTEGGYVVTARDHLGAPVDAEVSFSVADEAVFQFGEDFAGDPRSFFHGNRRPNAISWNSSFQSRPYVRHQPVVTRYELRENLQGEMLDRMATKSETRFLMRRSAARSDALQLGMVVNGAAAPAAAMMLADSPAGEAKAGGAGGDAAANVVVRSDFRETAFWQPDVRTGTGGSARVAVRFPDSATRWIATARAFAADHRVGIGTNALQTRLPLMVRLQTPRFVVVGDTVSVAALIRNNTDRAVSVNPTLELEGAERVGVWRNGGIIQVKRAAMLEIPAGGEITETWAVTATRPGPVRFKATAAGATDGDAMERTIQAVEHGMEQFAGSSVRVADGDAELTLRLPSQRKPGSTTVRIDVTPSLAATLLDALPYLADYPYGCTEQTLSRFLPAVLVRRTLRDAGIDAETAMARTFGGIEPAHAAATHPGGRKDLSKLDAMVAAGLERLADFQHEDGGWGWWKEGSSDAWMTAYVVWGLSLAREAGIDVPGDRTARAAAWLDRRLVELESDPATAAWVLHALAAAAAPQSTPSAAVSKAMDRLLAQEESLTAYSRALGAIALNRFGRTQDARRWVVNLENGVVRDDAASPGLAGTGPASATVATAHWGRDTGWHRWQDGPVESTATVLRALLAIDPANKLAVPAATWLQRNRRGAQWNNTRDTALTVLALNDWLRVTGEAKPDLAFRVEVDGRTLAEADVRGRPLWDIRRSFEVPAEWLTGTHVVRIRRTAGTSPIHAAVQARWFSTEEPVRALGNELFLRRDYFRLVPRETLLRGTVLDRVPLADGESVRSGDRIESVLTMETKNEGEYLLLEDTKPAGFEAVEQRSGGGAVLRELRKAAANAPATKGGREPEEYGDRTASAHAEWRDRHGAFFVDRIGQGFWELRSEFRAERPGRFHALPATVEAMYVPELRANGDEVRLEVHD